jgi:hypothetical protein
MISDSGEPVEDDSLQPDDAALLELEVDVRIYDLLLEAWGELDWDERLIGRYLRLAYAAGYLDALREPRRGELCRSHGFPVPKRRPR